MLFRISLFIFPEFSIDWLDDNSIRSLIKNKAPTCIVRKTRIVQQALAMLTIEEIKNNIAILDNESFMSENNDKKELRCELSKLIERYRRNMQSRRCKEKKKKTISNYPSRANNIQVTTCGIRKREELNNRRNEQRKKKRLVKNGPAYISVTSPVTKKKMSDIDLMRRTCLEHGGYHLNRYDWSISGISSTEKKQRQIRFWNWCNDKRSKHKKMNKLNVYNVQQFNLHDNIERVANIAMFQFEHITKNVTTCVCMSCKEWVMIDSFRDNFKCLTCKTNKMNSSCFLKKNLQPIWRNDKNTVQYHVPEQLKGLTLYEELLIQKSAPYIPIIHLYNGSLGLKGHCIVFERESQGDINKLPRCETDVVCFNRQYGTKEGGREQKQMSITAKRDVLMNALNFLNKRHDSYKNIFIEEPKNDTVQPTVIPSTDDPPHDTEKNVSSSYCHDGGSTDITYSSVDTLVSVVAENNADVAFVKDLKKCVKKHNASVPVFDFPPTKKEPLR